MPRPPRIDSPGQWHHVMNRGAGRRIVFRNDCERWWFLEELARVEEQFGVEVHAFCLMDNHFHLLIRSQTGRLSDAMKSVGQRFTQRVNIDRGVDGAIFRGRFHSVRVERDAHLLWLFRYVNENPRGAGWEGPLSAYPWSGLAQTLGRRTDMAWCRSDEVEARFESPAAFERFVEGAPPTGVDHRSGEQISWELLRSSVVVARIDARRWVPDAEVRAVTLTLGVEHGLALDSHSDVARLPAHRRNHVVRRATARLDRDDDLRRLADRAQAALSLCLRSADNAIGV